MDPQNSNIIKIYLIQIAFVIFAVLIIWRLFSTQVIEGETYRANVEERFANKDINTNLRGSIFFKKDNGGNTLVAVSQEGFILGANPKKIQDKEKVFIQINEVIKLDKTLFENKLAIDSPFVILNHNIKVEEADKLKAMKIDGLVFRKNKIREYPWNNLASHVIGFSRYTELVPTGEYGLEKYYNNILSDLDENNVSISPFADVLLDLKSESKITYPADLITTIDIWSQLLLEKEVSDINKKWSSKKTGGIILNPKTGEVIAMAAVPNYNLNEYSKEGNFSVFLNPNVEDIYEFGSIMKPLTIAIGLDSKKINLGFEYDDFTGSVEVANYTIHNFDKRGRGADIKLQNILSESLNTGIYSIVKESGIDTIKEYLEKLELGQETGIDIPNEIAGKNK